MAQDEWTRVELLLLAFERNSRANAALLAGIVNSDLSLSYGGGWSVAQHLCHLAAFRRGWLMRVSPKHAERLELVAEAGDGEDDVRPLVSAVDEIADAFRAGDAAALAAVEEALAEGRLFEGYYQQHPSDLLVHILVHDAHHRGQVMTLLRQGGRSREDLTALEEATWPLWRE